MTKITGKFTDALYDVASAQLAVINSRLHNIDNINSQAHLRRRPRQLPINHP